MYLRTISTQNLDYVENNFTLEELSSDTVENLINKLVDSKEQTTTVWINNYNTITKIHKEV